MTDIVQRLWDSDQASALTNEAAREIERRDWMIEKLRVALDQLVRAAVSEDPDADELDIAIKTARDALCNN